MHLFENVVWKMAAILSWPECVNRNVDHENSILAQIVMYSIDPVRYKY